MLTIRFQVINLNDKDNETIKILFLNLLPGYCSVVNAQGITSVSGTISDSFGPVVGAAIVEMDASNRNISATVTDFNGNFTLKIKNPKTV
mgnify:CR=1 FL=1